MHWDRQKRKRGREFITRCGDLGLVGLFVSVVIRAKHAAQLGEQCSVVVQCTNVLFQSAAEATGSMNNCDVCDYGQLRPEAAFEFRFTPSRIIVCATTERCGIRIQTRYIPLQGGPDRKSVV